jgi:hypothetical protein
MDARMIFPFTLSPSDKFGGIPNGFKDVFLSAKPADLIWFASDVIVISETLVEFVVFGMRDFVYGGIGDHLMSFRTDCLPSVTRDSVVKRCIELAQIQREREIEYSEDVAIGSYANALLDELAKDDPK